MAEYYKSFDVPEFGLIVFVGVSTSSDKVLLMKVDSLADCGISAIFCVRYLDLEAEFESNAVQMLKRHCQDSDDPDLDPTQFEVEMSSEQADLLLYQVLSAALHETSGKDEISKFSLRQWLDPTGYNIASDLVETLSPILL